MKDNIINKTVECFNIVSLDYNKDSGLLNNTFKCTKPTLSSECNIDVHTTTQSMVSKF